MIATQFLAELGLGYYFSAPQVGVRFASGIRIRLLWVEVGVILLSLIHSN